ncbi:hypothetical protein DRJ12_04650 [Candidatus Acetothermia bacterium]|nr:MAG: hypothetical protein DRJ12_04650 [Candidatus Acetothermia bacterium]
MTDLVKIGVIAAIMGAILLVGMAVDVTPPSDQQVVAVTATAVAAQPTLEMLDPVYSEKGVFQDDTIRIAFDASFVDGQAESRLQFWLHNVSDDAITILWDRCSIQLPDGNTVKVLSEESLDDFIPLGNVVSIAPGGDLFDAAIPITEISSNGAGGWTLTSGVLDAGTFTFVFAVERGVPHPAGLDPDRIRRQIQADGCDGATKAIGRALLERAFKRREIVYYTFRFVIR